MPARDRMQTDLVEAMKTGDKTRVSVLRSALAALANDEAVVDPPQSSTPVAFGTTEVPRRDVDEAEARRILTGELEELGAVATDLRERGRAAEAADLETRASILREYLDG